MAAAKSLVLVLAGALALAGCDWMKKEAPDAKSEAQLAAEARERLQRACASEGTYDRLKELVFDEAARIRQADPRQLDPVAASSVVRMEEPVVKSRDETLNVTVCEGRFILELPPGAENAFDGRRRIAAEVEYAAQAAADGSGLVYHLEGAEPIIYRLATIGLRNGTPPQRVDIPQPSAPPGAAPQVAVVDPEPGPRPAPPAPAPAPKAADHPADAPSFPCRYAKTATEKMVCGSPALAAKDRQMASIYYAAMADADAATKAHLRRSRDAFLVRRERCGSAECVTAAYNSRIAEIRRIAAGD